MRNKCRYQIKAFMIYLDLNKKLNIQLNRTFSETKALNPRKRLAKIDESITKKKKMGPSIHQRLYFKSPEKSDHCEKGHRQCKCAQRLENFRLKQKKKQKVGDSHSHNKYNDY